MNRGSFARLQSEIFEQCQRLREAGQKEYAHDFDNAFANFERLSKDLELPREKILWVFLQKHLDGIKAYINGHRSQREHVSGRIKDAIVYLTILYGMFQEIETEAFLSDEDVSILTEEEE